MRGNTRRYRRADDSIVTKVVERHVDQDKIRTIEAEMANIGAGGVYVRYEDPPPRGTIVEVHLSLPGVDHTVVALGLVRWSRRGKQAGMGVQICHIEEGSRQDIELYVEALDTLTEKSAEIDAALGEEVAEEEGGE